MDECDLGAITLTRKATPTRTLSVSLPEAVAWFAGERHSDRPHCVSPVLLTTATVLGSRLPYPKRQRLKRFVPALVGTANDGQDERRSLIAMDWLVRVYTPAWLRLVPALDLAQLSLTEHSPVLTVTDAAAALEGPLATVHRVAWAAYTDTLWDRHDRPHSASRNPSSRCAGGCDWPSNRPSSSRPTHTTAAPVPVRSNTTSRRCWRRPPPPWRTR